MCCIPLLFGWSWRIRISILFHCYRRGSFLVLGSFTISKILRIIWEIEWDQFGSFLVILFYLRYQKLQLCLNILCLCGRLPFWPYAKLIATCWLVIPYFSGAAYVYEHFVRPLFVNPRTVNIWYVPRKKDVFSKPDDILTAAEKYIQENGPDAFENIINRVSQQSHLIFFLFVFWGWGGGGELCLWMLLRTTTTPKNRDLVKILLYE